MNRSILVVAALVALSAADLTAQSLVGTWQGTVQSDGKDQRIVVKVTAKEHDALEAVLYRIDQGARPWPASSITLQGFTVRFAVPGISGTYEGKLNAIGNSIAGIWTIAPAAMPLNLIRATSETAWEIPAQPAPLKPMSPDANPVFEVATIKPSKGEGGISLRIMGHRFVTQNTTVIDLIAFAYNLHAKQVVDGPAWLATEKWDIVGEPDGEGAPSLDQWRVMFQKLLADRFQLTFHRDKKELSAYAITVAKNGPKLTKSGGNPNGIPGFRGPAGKFISGNANMAEFAEIFADLFLDRPMVDQTGLQGRYDFTLEWTPDQATGRRAAAPPPPADDLAAPPDLFAAFQQQLGLKVEAVKAPISVIAIDRVEKPSENQARTILL